MINTIFRRRIYTTVRNRAHKFCQSWAQAYGAVPGRWAGTRRETRSVTSALDFLHLPDRAFDRINA